MARWRLYEDPRAALPQRGLVYRPKMRNQTHAGFAPQPNFHSTTAPASRDKIETTARRRDQIGGRRDRAYRELHGLSQSSLSKAGIADQAGYRSTSFLLAAPTPRRSESVDCAGLGSCRRRSRTQWRGLLPKFPFPERPVVRGTRSYRVVPQRLAPLAQTLNQVLDSPATWHIYPRLTSSPKNLSLLQTVK